MTLLPPPPELTPSVLKLTGVGPRPVARAAAREAIQAALRQWFGHAIALVETPRGPRTDPASAARDVRLSLTYAGDDAWIAFHRGPVGLDACLLRDFPERAAVGALYLGGTPPDEPAAEFAVRWTRHEAALKHGGLTLTEGVAPPAPPHLRSWTEAAAALALAWS